MDRPQRAARARRPSLAGAPGAPFRHGREADAGDERILGGSEFVEELRRTLDTEGRVWYKKQAPPENATAVAENVWA